MIGKIIALGFAFHPYSYLRNKWNWLDFAVVFLAYVLPSTRCVCACVCDICVSACVSACVCVGVCVCGCV